MKASRRRVAVLLLATLVARCAHQPERAVLDRFFGASRLRDRTALSGYSTVLFEPLEHGIVTSFEIVRVIRENDDSKRVSIEAPVKLPDGRVVQRTIDVTIERKDGRWLVTAFRM